MQKKFSVKRFHADGQDGGWRDEFAEVAVEAPLTIDIEGLNSYTTLCSPGDKRSMVVGFLFTEGIIQHVDDIAVLAECADNPDIIRVRLSKTAQDNASISRRNMMIVSSCGLCGTVDIHKKIAALPPVDNTLRVDTNIMNRMMDLLYSKQTVHKQTGGTHAILIFDAKGNMLSFAEDIGRHNALDKAIGQGLLTGSAIKGSGAVFSGRVSFDMVAKCSRAGIEVVLAVSAPTSLALNTASACGITICAFVRNGGATLYTHPERIKHA